MSEMIVGIDIGTTKIACFVGVRNEHGKIEILSMGYTDSLGVHRGIVENIEKTIQSIKIAVEETQKGLPGEPYFEITSAYVGIAGQHIKSIQHRGMLTRENIETEISQQDINHLLEDMSKMRMPPGERIINIIPKEYIIDNQQGIKEPIGHAGVHLEANFHIITGNVGACTNIMRCAARANINVENLVLEPMASAEAVLSSEEKEAGIVLVDIGGGTTDVAVFYDGIIQHTAIIPFGGNAITDDIKEGCMILRNYAEQLKIRFGYALPTEDQKHKVVAIPGLRGHGEKEISILSLTGIINARMTEIIELIDYEIVNSGLKKKLIGGIVLTGGGAELKHIKQLFEYVTGMDTRIGYPTEHLANTNRLLDTLASPMYSTGIGLVLMGFNDYDKKKMLQTITDSETEDIQVQATKKRKNLLDSLVEKGKSWFIGEELEEDAT